MVLLGQLRFGLDRRVHCIVRHVEEKRGLGVFLDPCQGLIGEPVSKVFAFLSTLVQPRNVHDGTQVVFTFVRPKITGRRATRVAGNVDVEALISGQVTWPTKVPFANAGGCVTSGFKRLSDSNHS